MVRRLVLAVSAFASLGADLSWFEAEAPTTLNPLFARTMADERAQELVFDRIFYRLPIMSQPGSDLVERYERVDRQRGFRLHLKRVFWQDGTPLTANDVCFTVDAMLDPETPVGRFI